MFLLFIRNFFVKVEHKSLTLGEVLDGDRMAVALYDLKFKGSSACCEISYDGLLRFHAFDTDLFCLNNCWQVC